MSESASAQTVESGFTYRRLIGRYAGDRPGPLLLCVAGLHGNEPAGVTALEHVMDLIRRRRPRMRGDLVGLAGNLGALECGRRFIDEDLNRMWQRARVDAVLARTRPVAGGNPVPDSAAPDPAPAAPLGTAELREQRELLEVLDRELDEARGDVFVLDLHTTSAESAPFATLGDTRANREFALMLPLPVVLGLEEQIDGAMLEHLDQRGFVGIGIEGGEHEAKASVQAHEDSLWIALAALDMVAAADIPDLAHRRARLAHASQGLPRALEVRYRHDIRPEDTFKMVPGFRNFERVEAGQVVGASRSGPVEAPESGRIFLPLYQELGNDGFFIVHDVNPAWLRVSAVLRGLGVDHLAPFIPGVKRHPERAGALVLRLEPSRILIGMLHLLGFRKRVEADRVLMIRRAEHSPHAPVEHVDRYSPPRGD
jgi:succinylglutamate desuccinylase